MKRFLLPTVMTLAISGSYVFADEPTQETVAPIAPPAQVVNPEIEKYMAAMEKRIAEQQAAMEKRMAEQKAIIEKKMEQQQKKYYEMMEKRNAKIQEMQKRIEQSRTSKKSFEDYQKMMDKTQKMHEKMRKENTPPAWANRPPVPNWNVPYAQQPRAYRPNVPISRDNNHANVGQSLKNIEKLLQEVITILQKK
ncbi:MAG TPA: hypothetical protein ENK59_01805 [Thioploca sp.]|nr:hypothetical protein [Thioploca sp.]